jgi:NAD(P)-dependent dehydrogenase (short-subunit alcohol dehydrogenase family)
VRGSNPFKVQIRTKLLVYILDRIPEPSPDFVEIHQRAENELDGRLYYRQIDVQDVSKLNEIVEAIGTEQGRLDGLIAAAGINQQETSALDYTAENANKMFAVNIIGVFMAAQAAARQVIRFGNGGSIVLIASMSGTVVNRVSFACVLH